MKVPFLDLKARHASLIDKFDRATREVIESSRLRADRLWKG